MTESTALRAFHGDEAVKTRYLDRVAAHREADNLMKGRGWGGGKGCAIGCTLEAYDHSCYPVELGIPQQLAHLEDAIFEGLDVADAMLWPTQFLEAIPVGADLETVGWQFLVWMLRDSGLLDAAGREDVCKAIDMTIAVLEEPANGRPINRSAESAARSAESAARSAARSAESAARSAAWSAARSAESAARSAACSAACSAARSAACSAESAAWSAAWKKMADRLLDFLRAASL